VVSENSSESRWVQNEVTRAERKGKPIFPLLLDGEPWIAIEATQYVDVQGGKLPASKFYGQLSKVLSKDNVGLPSPLRRDRKITFLFHESLVWKDSVIPLRQNTMWLEINKSLLFFRNMVASCILSSIQICSAS
jgi:hypothetical protein